MYKDSFLKGKDCVLRCPIKLVLLNCVRSVLACKLAFQFHRNYRNAVDKQYDINAVFIVDRIVQLSGAV